MAEFLYTAGLSKMVLIDECRSHNLTVLAFKAYSNKQVSLTGRQLIEQVYIGFFILFNDLLHSLIGIIDYCAVKCCEKLV